jgi:hypothetical protein
MRRALVIAPQRVFTALVVVVVMAGTAVTVGAAGTRPAHASVQAPRQWVARFDGIAHGEDYANTDVVSPDGSVVYVTGGATGLTGSLDTVTIAYRASTGAKLWVASYDGPGHDLDLGQAMALSPDGSVLYVFGASTGAGTGYDWALLAYHAATGHRAWVARFDGPAHLDDYAQAGVAVSPDGSRVVAGGIVSKIGGRYDFATASFDSNTGAREWVRTYDGPDHGNDAGAAMVVGPDGTVYITGWSIGLTTNSDVATLAYDGATGQRLWAVRYNGLGNGLDSPCYVDCIKLSGDGSRAYVVGQTYGGASGDDYLTLAYRTSDGHRVWASRYDGPTGGSDLAWDLVVLSDGSRVVVNGQSAESGSTDSDVAVVSYNGSTGAQKWVSTYDGPAHGDDISYGSARTPQGDTVLVTGPSEGATSDYDILTIAYDISTGNQRWVDRYDGPVHGLDDGYAVSISSDGGRAYVVGDSTGTSLDYLTLAYRLT